MARTIYSFARKIHRYLSLPMILFIVANKLTTGTSVGNLVVPLTVITMLALAVTGGYMWFWVFFQSRRKKRMEEAGK